MYTEAQREYQRQYYLANKEKRIRAAAEGAKRHLEKQQSLIRDAKSIPCLDCKQSYPFYVMQFDHVRGEKKFNIGGVRRYGYISLDTLKSEIEKCEVVCANCHAVRTHERRTGSGT